MVNNTNNSILGVSFSGNTLLVGKVKNSKLTKSITRKIHNKGSEEEILTELIGAINDVFDDEITGIGIGVPSLVDIKNGVVYNVQKIPSWREVHLKDILESYFGVKVYINNDANCFAIGEKYFGNAKDYENVLGLIIGTGVGAGIIFKGHLYSGTNCGAGELGSLPYREHDFEYYCSKSYFEIKYGMKFELLLKRALNKDKIALAVFEQYGYDLGNLIKTILYTTDPEIIILGGTISNAFPFFEKTMLDRVKSFIYKHSLKKLKIIPSQQPETAIFGAVALFFDAQNITLEK
ncbi:MAG: ROK family protein [Flavobacteriaceae bacterium]|nr:ROK family protein [Flavobacteriaceae bacterium]